MLALFLVLLAGILLAGFLTQDPAIIGGIAAIVGLPLVVYAVFPYVTPPWVRRVARDGVEATAIVLANDSMKGIGGYSGPDLWIDLPARVEPKAGAPFQARIKCRLTQSWLIKAGSRIPVRYDPSHPNRAVLVGDLTAILRGRPRE